MASIGQAAPTTWSLAPGDGIRRSSHAGLLGKESQNGSKLIVAAGGESSKEKPNCLDSAENHRTGRKSGRGGGKMGNRKERLSDSIILEKAELDHECLVTVSRFLGKKQGVRA